MDRHNNGVLNLESKVSVEETKQRLQHYLEGETSTTKSRHLHIVPDARPKITEEKEINDFEDRILRAVGDPVLQAYHETQLFGDAKTFDIFVSDTAEAYTDEAIRSEIQDEYGLSVDEAQLVFDASRTIVERHNNVE